MSSEASVWMELTRARPANILGYLPGAIDQGVLAVSGPGQGTTVRQLTYSAFVPHGGELRSAGVCGLEVQLDYASVRRLENVHPDGGGIDALVDSVLPPEVSLLGSLPSSDNATLLVTRAAASDALHLWVAWWEAASTLVLLPAQGRVPAAALIPLAPAGGIDTPPPRASHGVVRRPSSRRMQGTFAAVAVVIVAGATWALIPKGEATNAASGPDAPGVVVDSVRADSQPLAGAAGADSQPDAGAANPDSQPAAATVPPSRAPGAITATRNGAAKSSSKPPLSGDQGAAASTTRIPNDEPRLDSTPVLRPPAKEVRVRDLASDKEELRALADQSLDAEERTTAQWQELGARGERLFDRLIEAENRSEVSRVILRLYGNGGGNTRACRYLGYMQGAGAVERRLFSQRNRCS